MPFKPSYHKHVGKKINRLTVLEYAGKTKSRLTIVLCKCDCGKKKKITLGNILSGKTKSCGCIRSELNIQKNSTHMLSNTSTYNSWQNMRNRCNNPNNYNFKLYGGRGIKVCDKWNDFESFLKDMGPRPKGKSIERINSNGNYEPKNCLWATSKQQSRNTSRTRKITINGKTMCVEDWAKLLGINAQTIRCRLHRGWDEKTAVLLPKGSRRNDTIPENNSMAQR